jgi:hypothetical protein
MKTADLDEVVVLREFPREAYVATPVLDALVAKGWPEKIVIRRLERMVAKRLLDYGVSVRFPWLTPDGLALCGGGR